MLLNLFNFTFVLLASIIICGKNFYNILQVKRDATQAEIKKSFKKLSLKYHPDKNKKDPETAKNKFIEISNAYEVLVDPEKRKIYDVHGEEGVNDQTARQNAGQRHGGNFEDVFSQFFGGGHGHHHRHHFQEEQEEKNHFENSDVLNLKMESLTKLYRRQQIWFVLFFKSDNRNFKELQEMWKTLAEKVYGIFTIAAVNCKSDEEICDEFSVRETPIIVYFPETGQDEEVYRGLKKWEDIFKFGSQKMQNFVRVVNSDNYGDFVTAQSNIHKVILFTERKNTSPLMKALSKFYRDKLSFGEIRRSQNELVSRFNIEKFPSLLVITDPENHKGVIYEGPLTRDSMEKFLNQYAYSSKKPEKLASFAELTFNLYTKNKLCNDSDKKNICLIYFTESDILNGEENKLLEELAKRYINDPIKVLYIRKNLYKTLSVSFAEGDENSDFILLKGKRKSYIPIHNAKTFDKVIDKVDNVLSGSGSYKKLKKHLNLQNTFKENRDEL